MKIAPFLLAAALLQPCVANAQDRAAIEGKFQGWIEQTVWPRAQAAGVTRATFDAAMSGVTLNWDLPNLVIEGAPEDTSQYQAEFRHPARYFNADGLVYASDAGAALMRKHAAVLAEIEARTGVPAQIIVSIWGRESSFGAANIPHDAFRILGTKGFMSTRAPYFTDELIAALQIVAQGFASRDAMRSSWAGALGQPQFMPSSYLKYAVDGDADGRVDIWHSEADTLASIGAYLAAHGWKAGRDWGFEVNLPADVPCYLEGPDQGLAVADWAARGVTRVSGQPFPQAESAEEGYLMMPAGRSGPAFIVTSNFYVLKDYNESDAYALFVGHVGDRSKFGVRDFSGAWGDLDKISRTDVLAMQRALEAAGHDVGGADGLIGNKTRRSIGLWQEQNGMPITCYPNSATAVALAR
ncbi:MAG: lytic murein transglycosylase [Yoonia sp.]|jgi:lytic murein transglycosylase